jgi:crotonobetainyl-CoA:carnitine CoA-transferase CaiB-like acyl-CoA transferase
MHNIAPASAARLGINAQSLHAKYPSLIACEVSGYGLGGPRSDDKAYDLAIQAEAGAFSVTGDGEMSKVGFSVADIASGMYALSSVLAALVRRDRTGEGAAVEVSMLDSLAEWMSAPLYATVHGGSQAPRTGRRHHAIAPYGTFALSDGRTVLLAIQNDREWAAFAEVVLGNSAFITDMRFATNAVRIANVDALESVISARFAEVSAEDTRAALATAGIATANVNDLAQVWQHEQLRARDRFVDVELPNGPIEMLKSPFDISEWTPGAQSVPALGEHDAAIVRRILETD